MTTHPLDPLLALSADQVTMFEMADAFRKAHDEHAALKIAKIFAAGQRAEANVIVGLRAALEVLSLRVPSPERDHSQCKFSTGICGATTAGTGTLDEYGYWEFPCETCAMRMELQLQMSKVGELTDQVAYWREMHRAANARADGVGELVAKIQQAMNEIVPPVTMTETRQEYWKAGARAAIRAVSAVITKHRTTTPESN